jgi:hypothetical protein
MAMQFTRVVSPVADIEIWNASSDGCSFVISYEPRRSRLSRTARLCGIVARSLRIRAPSGWPARPLKRLLKADESSRFLPA